MKTAREFAQEMHYNEEVVRRWLRTGKIKGIKIGSQWRIPDEEIKRLIGDK